MELLTFFIMVIFNCFVEQKKEAIILSLRFQQTSLTGIQSRRKLLLESIRYVDLVIPEENWEQKISDVKEFKVDTFVMGNDWEGKFDFLKDYCEVVYLERTPEISTTQIKKDLGQ